jgi:orotate phosphoribosyltransferase
VGRHVVRVHVAALEAVLLRTYELGIFESYERPFARRGADELTSTWALDLRVPLSHGEILAPVAEEMAAGLARVGIVQVAGYGFGAYALVGALVASSPGLVGGLLRPRPKTYGFRERVEGDLDPTRPVALVDDLLGSGRTALKVTSVMRDLGLVVTEVHTVFALGFRSGATLLGQAGVAHRCLATLTTDPAFQVPREMAL